MCKPNIKCEVCGIDFYKQPHRIKKDKSHNCSIKCLGVSKHRKRVSGIESKFGKPIDQLLKELYTENTMTSRQISKYIGLCHGTVLEWLKIYGIEIRQGSEAIKTQWDKPSSNWRRELSRELASSHLNSKENREKLKSIMQTCEYKEKQSTAKKGIKNGMYGVCGENHPNWNPSRTSEQRKLERKTTKDYVWRASVFDRDSYTCIKCGYDKGGIIVAHHINSYDIHENERHEISNGVVLCEQCHKDFHKKYGYGKNTKEQFQEYLKAD